MCDTLEVENRKNKSPEEVSKEARTELCAEVFNNIRHITTTALSWDLGITKVFMSNDKCFMAWLKAGGLSPNIETLNV